MHFDEIYLKKSIRAIPDWPQAGVTFRDVAPLFRDPKALHIVIDAFCQHYMDANISHIASLDARGFLIGSVLAYKLNLPLILIRKKGKLPWNTLQQDYQLEYGSATVEIQEDACTAGDRILIVDDLIASGGSMLAAATLIRRLGADVVGGAAIIDLPDLQGSTRLREADIALHTLIAY